MIKVCKSCLMPSTRPRVGFDQDGICNACRNSEGKREIDWQARRKDFINLVEQHRGKDGAYDCVVPWSGGKDSSSIAHRLKHEFGLNPLLVTFSPLVPNRVGELNREAMCRAGFDTVMIRPNQQVSRHLSRRFFIERGNPKTHWDAGVNAAVVRLAVNYRIPLVFYAEHGESEYGGRVLSEEHKRTRDITEVLEHQIGDDPSNWVDEVVSDKDLYPYVYPDLDQVHEIGLKAMYFSYFFKWSMFDNYEYIKRHIDFKTCESGRTDGTFTNFDSLDDKIDNIYYYMQFIKFGFGRAVRDASRLIQLGQLTRAKGLEYVRSFDAEFPATNFAENLEYLGLSESEFTEIVDRHRNPEIWERSGNEWRLKFHYE